MRQSSIRLVVFSIYCTLLGATLLIHPNSLLTVFGLAPTQEVYIRILGYILWALDILLRDGR